MTLNKMKSLCVFCGSSGSVSDEYLQVARNLGKILAQNDIQLVYGGSRVGLMGAVADSTMEHGGKVLGVIPQYLEEIEFGHNGISELVIVDSMHTRKMTMFERSDGFIALPGGFGTLDESFEILTWKQIQLHEKPVVFFNKNGYWDPFVAMVDKFIEEKFALPTHKGLFEVVDTLDEVLPALNKPFSHGQPLADKYR